MTHIDLGTGRTFDPQWRRVGIDAANFAQLTKQMRLKPAWRSGTIKVLDANGHLFPVAMPTIATWRPVRS